MLRGQMAGSGLSEGDACPWATLKNLMRKLYYTSIDERRPVEWKYALWGRVDGRGDGPTSNCSGEIAP